MWEAMARRSPGRPEPSSFTATGSASRPGGIRRRIIVFDPFAAFRRAPYVDSAFVLAEIDPAAVRRARQAMPLKRDDRPAVTLANLERIVHRNEDQ
jgi:hypothetical protein